MPWFSPDLARRKPPGALFLALLSAPGPVAMHMFVPALPLIARDLEISAAEAQLTLTLYIFGMAVGQLIYGPLSDRFGRRPMVLAGQALYIVSMFGAAIAAEADLMIALRLFQAIGGSGAMVLGRAIVRDATSNDRAVGQLAILSFTMSAAISFAPAIGGYLAAWLGWRFLFVAMGSLGIIGMAVAYFALPETHHRRLTTNGFVTLYQGFLRLAPQRTFTGHVIGGSLSSMQLYGFVAASPFLFVEVLHRPIEEVGLYYVFMLGGVMVGAVIANRLSGKVPPNLLARIGNALGLLASLAFLLADITGHLSVLTMVAPIIVFNIALGIASPNAIMGATSADPRYIGAASGIYGFTQMGFGAFCSFIVGLWHGSGAMPVALLMVIASVIGHIALWIARPAR
jgi:DHA1 family bicyclomycin/chloramphenicol resistance-like MFS transporter